MRLVTFRNNEGAYQGLRGIPPPQEGDKNMDPVSIATAAVSVYNVLSGIFGGGGNKGGYVNGRFVPGDLNNRLAFLSQRLVDYGLSAYDIDKALVDSFIYQPSGWQGNIDRYVLSVYNDKKANPNKYNNTPTPGGGTAIYTDGSGASLSGFGNTNFTTILLIGAGVFVLANVLGGKKRGKR